MAWLLLAGLLSAAAADATPTAEDLLARAGAQAAALEEELAVITATEEHDQRYSAGRDRKERRIVSDVVWVPTGDAMVWAFFRDVTLVDGAPGARPHAPSGEAVRAGSHRIAFPRALTR